MPQPKAFPDDTPRRVLIIVENLPVPLDRRVWLEATSLRKAGYTVSVICPMGRGFDKAHEVLEGVHIYRHPLAEAQGPLGYVREYTSALWHQARLAIRVRRLHGFDVIHGCNPPDLIFLIAWMFRPVGVSYLFDHHDICPELFEAKFGRTGLVYRCLRLLERLTFRTASVSLATNESFREVALHRAGMAPEDVFVVRSAPPIEQFRPVEVAGAANAGSALTLGYVGVIGAQEGMDLLIHAFEDLVLHRGHRDLKLLVIGFGPGLANAKADVAARGLADHVTFTGQLFGDALIERLQGADICVSPDPKNEMNDRSTMNKVLEYMALGKPVVQFDLREGRASCGDAALYAEPNDPADFADRIESLINDPHLRCEMGRLGRRRMEQSLSWEFSVPPLLAAYDRLFAKRRAASQRRWFRWPRLRRRAPHPAAKAVLPSPRQ